ncbi:MAG: hypothetical protein AAGC46_18585 [Solirubrobacteraceae bacterium]
MAPAFPPTKPVATPTPPAAPATPPGTVIRVSGRALAISAILKPTAPQCPPKVSAATDVGGHLARARLIVSPVTTTGVLLCDARGRLVAAKRPEPRKRFKVSFYGSGVKPHAVGVTTHR